MMRGLARAVATVADYILARSVAATPRICDGCGRTWTRLTPDQCTDIGKRVLPTCRRWRCDGRLYPIPIEATDRLITDLRKNGAPGWTPGTPPHCTTDGWKEPKAMTRSIPRRAHDVHAGDIITHDPDHDRAVRWRASRRAEVTGDGVAIIDYVDQADGSVGIAYYGGLTELTVEPVGGAA